MSEELDEQEQQAAEIFSQLLDPANLATSADPAPSQQSAKDCYQWQASRRRADREGHFNIPFKGFGPEGEHTLWLPSPKQTSQWQFADGEPKLVQAASCFDDPAIAAARDETLATFQSTGRSGHLPQTVVLKVGASFLKYARLVLCANYNLSDADLNFLLASGTKWQTGMVMHLLGGEDIIEQLCKMGMVQPIKTSAPTAPKLDIPAGMIATDNAPPPPCMSQPVGILKKRRARRWGLLDWFRR